MKNRDFTNLEVCDNIEEFKLESPVSRVDVGIYATTEALNSVRATLVELQKEIKQLHQWLAGGVDHNGRPIPGVLQTIDQIRSARKWILGLLGAIAVSSVASAATNLIHQAH